ncbi:portal_HK97, phage portal protein, HK97 family [uncultured Caudovirales phage]|uniref:Portal_HK97, phage portal protein, HK97 family n=1 Tax=uncultured Caudovirales phage TaxID=2100421 RepID=A0A6J5LXD7_9CAUD|nr:portal_HK97, phage portal protein, HK97 family [uncultured Caudovirales phage]
MSDNFITRAIAGRFRFSRNPSLSVKGVESNRAPVPRGFEGGGVGWYDDLIAAIRGLDVKQSKTDWVREVGDFRKTSIVSLCHNWIGTSFPQARPVAGKMVNGVFTPLKTEHPAIRLLNNPSPIWSSKRLIWALSQDWWPTGTAYLHVVRTGAKNLTGDIKELEWLFSDLMEPKSDSTGHLAYWKYNAGGRILHYDPREVIAIPFGVDPASPHQGLSPLLAQIRWIAGDHFAGEYAAGILKGGGLPAAVLVPEGSAGSGPGGASIPAKPLDKDKAEELTDRLNAKLKDEPGKIPFIGNAVKLITLGFKPSEMALNDLLEEPETRIPAAYGIPPEVLKLRVGLSRSTENNIEQSRKAAWEDCLVPCQDIWADVFTHELMQRLYGDDLVIQYDRSNVEVLRPNRLQQVETVGKLFQIGIVDRHRAKELAGETPEEADKGVYATSQAPTAPDPAQKKTVIRSN